MFMLQYGKENFNAENNLSKVSLLFKPARGFKWGDKKMKAKLLAERFLRAPETMPDIRRMGATMDKCSEYLGLQYCPDCGTYHVGMAFLCKFRLCPICSWRRSATRAAEMLRVADVLAAERPDLKAALLTLTVENVDLRDLRSTVSKMLNAWNLLRKRRVVDRWVAGTARSIEITRNDRVGTYHPHIHVLVLFKEGYSTYEPQIRTTEWVRLWRECLGVDYDPVCDIRFAFTRNESGEKIYGDLVGAIAESGKYVTKPAVLDEMEDEELWMFARALYRIRMYAYTGVIAEMRHRLSIDDDAIDVDPILECPKCASPGLIEATLYWSSRSDAYVAAAVDGVIDNRWQTQNAEAIRMRAESSAAAAAADSRLLRQQLSAAIAKK